MTQRHIPLSEQDMVAYQTFSILQIYCIIPPIPQNSCLYPIDIK